LVAVVLCICAATSAEGAKPASAKSERPAVQAELAKKVAAIDLHVRQWETMQMAYHQETELVTGRWQTLGFEPPQDQSVVTYQEGDKSLVMRLNQEVGQCPKGAKWTVRAKPSVEGSWEVTFHRTRTHKACDELLPQFRPKP
jgi:hypothetical protein